MLQGPKSHIRNSNKANVKERNGQVLLCCCTNCTSSWNVWKCCLKRDSRTKSLFTTVCQWLGLHWVCQVLLTPWGRSYSFWGVDGNRLGKVEDGERGNCMVYKINKTFKMEEKRQKESWGCRQGVKCFASLLKTQGPVIEPQSQGWGGKGRDWNNGIKVSCRIQIVGLWDLL